MRMPFGIVCAQYIFQQKMEEIFSNLEGLGVIVDDIIVSGKDDKHDRNLIYVLERARKEGATFQWTDVHKSEMEKIKVSICHNLEAFDAQSKEVELKTDSSKHGLGAELLTHGKIVAFATKALNEMKQCYSQAPPRLQRMIYQIQAYDLEVQRIIGKDILVADALSSLHPSEENDEFQNEIKFHVNSFVKHILNFREELAVVNGIILKADQIVIASTIQPNILQHLHVPHMGMEKTKWKAQTVMNSGQTM
ncbi:hypothetical protein QYM36_006438 [Artemia franciscana]|uniref:Reverse transcriptase/retrotransposon-derived protein RNase H-like domain-containing protein n=1 Tax=Artemia franciscana TaxID=6661 RepID=A0AA88I3S8_ARTSF|nr:hypothetical protein QYM36_006438 [Artemia franciscana]